MESSGRVSPEIPSSQLSKGPESAPLQSATPQKISGLRRVMKMFHLPANLKLHITWIRKSKLQRLFSAFRQTRGENVAEIDKSDWQKLCSDSRKGIKKLQHTIIEQEVPAYLKLEQPDDLKALLKETDSAKISTTVKSWRTSLTKCSLEQQVELFKRVLPGAIAELLTSQMDQFRLFIRGLSINQRDSLQQVLQDETLMKNVSNLIQTKVLEIIKEERVRTSIAIACDPEAKNQAIEEASSLTQKADLETESYGAVYSLSQFAGDTLTCARILKEMMHEESPQGDKKTRVIKKNLGKFALKWAQLHQSDLEFQRNTKRWMVQSLLVTIAKTLTEIDPDMAFQLSQSATSLGSRITLLERDPKSTAQDLQQQGIWKELSKLERLSSLKDNQNRKNKFRGEGGE